MIVHLVDGTYELFRCFYGLKHSTRADDGNGGVRLVLHTVLQMVEEGRRTSAWRPITSSSPFATPSGRGTRAAPASSRRCWRSSIPWRRRWRHSGSCVWPMVELEADDALASAAAAAAAARGGAEGVHLDAGQGPGPVRGRGSGGAGGPALGARSVTRRRSWRSSACRRARSRTTWRWWATARTGIRGSPDGERSPPRRCSPATDALRTYPSRTRSGAPTRQTPDGSRRACGPTGSRPCCFASWRRFERMPPLFVSVEELRWKGPQPRGRGARAADRGRIAPCASPGGSRPHVVPGKLDAPAAA